MRAIKYKYALAMNFSIVENEEGMIYRAIEQAQEISEQLEIQVNLHNPFNNKSCLIDNTSEFDEIFEHLKS